jgi:hypothetical protein
LDAGERPSKTSQPLSRTKIRYSRRKDTADHHVLRLIWAHRRSSEARQALAPHKPTAVSKTQADAKTFASEAKSAYPSQTTAKFNDWPGTVLVT